MKKALALIVSVVMIFGSAVLTMADIAGGTLEFLVTIEDSGVFDSGVEGTYTVTRGGTTTVVDSATFQFPAEKVEHTQVLKNFVRVKSTYESKKGDVIKVNLTKPSNYSGEVTCDKDSSIGNYIVMVKKIDSTGGGSHSGGGGGGGGGTMSSTLVNGNANTGLVTGNLSGSVSSATASKAAANAVTAAVKSAVASGANNADATVTLTNAGKITPAIFKSIVSAAEKASKGLNVDVTVSADTVKGKAVMGRLYMELNEAARLTEAVNTSIDVNAASKVNAAITKKFNQYFSNDVAVVSFGQKGTFGMDVKAAVKVDTSKLDTAKLKFYSYNTSTNAYTEMANTDHFVDTNGYVHFATNMGNTVIIADAPLTSK